MDAIIELKACPFCGSASVLQVGSYVRCGRCGAAGPYGETDVEARQRWNERSGELSGSGAPQAELRDPKDMEAGQKTQ
jgi:Lar family restriction alleviation protein